MPFEIKEDPIEYSDEYLKIELELERLIRDEIGDGGYFGFCRRIFWIFNCFYDMRNVVCQATHEKKDFYHE